MTTREKIFCMFLSDEDRGITPQQRGFYNMLNQSYHTMFYEPWKEYMKPFKVAGNVYFIGNRLVSVHLIETEEGLIIYDSGFQHTMPLLMQAILDLGHKPEEVRYVIMTHGHFDHYGSAAWFQGLYGAKVCYGAEEKDHLDVPRFGTIPRDDYSLDTVEADILLRTGDEITLGGSTIRFYEVPRHSAGSLAGFMDTEEDGKPLRVCFYGDGGYGLYKPHDEFKDEKIDELRKIRERSFALLADEYADVFTAGHPRTLGYDALGKHAANEEDSSRNHFIDPECWKKAYEQEKKVYEEALKREEENQQEF